MRREATEGLGLEHTGPEVVRGLGTPPPPSRQVMIALGVLRDHDIVRVRFHGASRTNYYFLTEVRPITPT